MPVDVFHWNPRRPVLPGRVGRRVPIRRPINNFGDLIGPMIVDRILDERAVTRSQRETARGRLLTVGSVLHFAEPGDVVWGSGINGKKISSVPDASKLDIRSVRGPLTRQLLSENGGSVPETYGDPGLLWGVLFPRQAYQSQGLRQATTVVPNLHDFASIRSDPRVVNPCNEVHDVVRRIANSDFVCGSSLHGIIIAESMGIPARLVTPGVEPPFKYADYYRGTGRDGYVPAASVDEAVAKGGEPPISWDPADLLAAFPIDLWQ